jgi:pimeloyl-ACP methyl ester carboxylesterase
VLEPPTPGVSVDFVVGGRSDVLAPEDLARLERAARAAPEQLRVTVLPAAGHWVHVDDPAGVSSVILDALRR